jgi:hypothetical protein
MDFIDSTSASSGASQGKQKTLNDIHVLRMLYLDYFFLFMGVNAEVTPDG